MNGWGREMMLYDLIVNHINIIKRALFLVVTLCERTVRYQHNTYKQSINGHNCSFKIKYINKTYKYC